MDRPAPHWSAFSWPKILEIDIERVAAYLLAGTGKVNSCRKCQLFYNLPPSNSHRNPANLRGEASTTGEISCDSLWSPASRPGLGRENF